MKFSDRFASILLDQGLCRGYGLQGGSVAHLIDSFVRLGGHMDYQHHEEHSLFAATGDYLVSRVPGLAFVSTGPAGTNALTGLLGAWQDGLPVLVVSGQSRSNEVSYGTEVRQIGSQEAPIVDIVKRITKKSLFFMPNENLEDCVLDLLNVAVSGRPGPVWIDLPIDVQLSEGF